MDAALHLVPAAPASGARVFARHDLAGAGLAADGEITLCLKGMPGQVVRIDTISHQGLNSGMDPEKFFATLRDASAPVARTLSFADHYAYTEVDAEKLLGIADAEKLRLVTTEKDLVRLTGATGALARLRERAEAFHVILEFENPTAIGEMIDDAVRKVALEQGHRHRKRG